MVSEYPNVGYKTLGHDAKPGSHWKQMQVELDDLKSKVEEMQAVIKHLIQHCDYSRKVELDNAGVVDGEESNVV